MEHNEKYSVKSEEVAKAKFNDLYAINCLIGFICACSQMMLIIVPYWIETDYHSSSELLGNVHIFKGFWTKCLTRHVSQWQCTYYEYSGPFQLRSIEGIRVTSITAMSLCWLSWILSFYGGQFIKVVTNERGKSIMVITAGVLGTISFAMWLTTLITIAQIISDEYVAETNFDRGLGPGGHGVVAEHGSHVFSDDDFKFRQGTCFYIALPIGILTLVNAVIYYAEGVLRLQECDKSKDNDNYQENSQESLIRNGKYTISHSRKQSDNYKEKYHKVPAPTYHGSSDESFMEKTVSATDNLWI